MNERKTHVERVEKFVRGSIWWCEDNGLKVCEPGKQHGKRPALIISSDDRGSSLVVEVLKITSQDKSNVCPGINIPVFMNGMQCYVLCNQHFTVTTDSLVDFIGICPENIMSECERGVLRACGMSQLVTMQNKYFDLTRTVEEVIDQRLSKYKALPEDSNKNQEVTDVIGGIIRGLNVMLNNAEESLKSQMVTEASVTGEKIQITTTPNIDKKDELDSVIEETLTEKKTSKKPKTKKNKKESIPVENNSKSKELGPVGSVRKTPTTFCTVEEVDGVKFERYASGKISWNTEAAKKFIDDCNTYPLATVCERWKFKDRAACSRIKYVIKTNYNL